MRQALGRQTGVSGIATLVLYGLLTMVMLPQRAYCADPSPPGPRFSTAALMQRLATVIERHDAFQEEKTLAALSYPLRSRGELLYRRPDHLEKTTISPQPERLVIDGDQLTIESGSGGPHTISLAEHPELAALIDSLRGTLAGDLPALQRNFQVESTGGATDWHLTLAPSRAEILQLVRSITIEGSGTRLRSIDIVQANGDRQHLTIEPAS